LKVFLPLLTGTSTSAHVLLDLYAKPSQFTLTERDITESK